MEKKDKITINFTISRRFRFALVLSFISFSLIIAGAYIAGYIDVNGLYRGIISVVVGLGLLASVVAFYRLNPIARYKVRYIAVGAWLGIMFGFLGSLLLRFSGGPIISDVIGGFTWFLVSIIISPIVGGLVGYWFSKRKTPASP